MSATFIAHFADSFTGERISNASTDLSFGSPRWRIGSMRTFVDPKATA